MAAGGRASYGGTEMSTTTTRLRTWLFVAGLTGLLIAAGALVGGAFLYVFVALAVLMNLVGYWFSDRIALAASRARGCSAAAGRWRTRSNRWSGGTQAEPMAVNPAFASLYVANPLPRAGVATLFSTHPPIDERVRRLRGYEGIA
jgi:Zn-dependent protease with chaperone function